MKRFFWIQWVIISLFFVLASAFLGVLAFQHYAARPLEENRNNTYRFLANLLESAPYQESLDLYARLRGESKTATRRIWILTAQGTVLATNTEEPLPSGWVTMQRPQQVHDIAAQVPLLQNFAELAVMRLAGDPPVYMVVKPEKDTPGRAIAKAEVVIFVLTLFCTSLAALCILFGYLRHTSREARQVMARLHSGDLAARFTIRKLDEIGILKLDFNAMAAEIEQLFQHIRRVENTRRDLLEELGHDLRTPLTSLKTAIETLNQFSGQLTQDQSSQLLRGAQGELDYFVRLIDDLFFIAGLPEPNQGMAHKSVDLASLCDNALRARQAVQPELRWELVNLTGRPTELLGDEYLLTRLLRNCLDNAGRYARTQVTATISRTPTELVLWIDDDGPGLTDEAIQQFGVRRSGRKRVPESTMTVSLGLGSVIIRTITSLHGGSLHAGNQSAEHGKIVGARVSIRFPVDAT